MKARQVVVVVWAGGVRASETLLDPRRRHVPRMWGELVPRGTLLTRLFNDGWTNHGPSLTALATGRWEVKAYDRPRAPSGRTVADAARRLGHSVLAVGKSRLELMTSDTSPDSVVQVELSGAAMPFADDEPAASIYRLKSYDRAVAAAFLERAEQAPGLSFLLFDDTDMAHRGRWSRYVAAIRQADELVLRLWQRLPPDTDLLVLPLHGRADHGATRWGFVGHGRFDAGCSRLWLLALGPDFAAGRVVEKRARLIDVAPTVARLLGFEFPCRGRVLEEALA
jgi:arylsulfatase A-like enzyme